jgi:hypothetical protein
MYIKEGVSTLKTRGNCFIYSVNCHKISVCFQFAQPQGLHVRSFLTPASAAHATTYCIKRDNSIILNRIRLELRVSRGLWIVSGPHHPISRSRILLFFLSPFIRVPWNKSRMSQGNLFSSNHSRKSSMHSKITEISRQRNWQRMQHAWVRNSYKLSVKNLEVNRPLKTLGRVWEGTVKLYLKEREHKVLA